jgi:hypothetical protein
MSSSRRGARVKVQSRLEALEVTLVNSRFGVAAHSFGGMDARVEPGLYELQLRAGEIEERHLLKLVPGSVHEQTNVSMPVTSPAPTDGTTGAPEAHRDAARQASRALQPQDGVVIMLRNLPGERFAFNRTVWERLQLVDHMLEPLPGEWHVDRRSSVATWSSHVGPGPVAMRLGRQDNEAGTMQPLWVASGWQTLVFVPNTRAGPAPEQATIHMARSVEGWEPESEHLRIGLALELALFGLRTGRPVVPRDLQTLLLRTKFTNPMLGVIGAHSLIRQPKPNFELLGEVLGNLTRLLGPDHPDIMGLVWLAEEARSQPHARQLPAKPLKVTWPPMLFAAYEALLRLDALRPGTLVTGSQAEDVAVRLDVTGVWTSWAEPTSAVRSGADLVQQRVIEYVRSVAAVHRIDESHALWRANEQQTAFTLGLPVGVVFQALNELRQNAGSSMEASGARGSKSRASYAAARKLIDDGTGPTEAFKLVAEQTGRSTAAVRAAYYRIARSLPDGGGVQLRARKETSRKRAAKRASGSVKPAALGAQLGRPRPSSVSSAAVASLVRQLNEATEALVARAARLEDELVAARKDGQRLAELERLLDR